RAGAMPGHGALARHRAVLPGATAQPVAAQAQPAWPTRSVTLVVTFLPGGMRDTVGRMMAERAPRLPGQPVLVENRQPTPASQIT
ncbi:hypothetical protein Q7A36_39910, partial [Paracraurococcus sp. LOR1-02]|nr:hypothetical protein [Paracraurococcus sp. LOR1-02]